MLWLVNCYPYGLSPWWRILIETSCWNLKSSILGICKIVFELSKNTWKQVSKFWWGEEGASGPGLLIAFRIGSAHYGAVWEFVKMPRRFLENAHFLKRRSYTIVRVSYKYLPSRSLMSTQCFKYTKYLFAMFV